MNEQYFAIRVFSVVKGSIKYRGCSKVAQNEKEENSQRAFVPQFSLRRIKRKPNAYFPLHINSFASTLSPISSSKGVFNIFN